MQRYGFSDKETSKNEELSKQKEKGSNLTERPLPPSYLTVVDSFPNLIGFCSMMCRLLHQRTKRDDVRTNALMMQAKCATICEHSHTMRIRGNYTLTFKASRCNDNRKNQNNVWKFSEHEEPPQSAKSTFVMLQNRLNIANYQR